MSGRTVRLTASWLKALRPQLIPATLVLLVGIWLASAIVGALPLGSAYTLHDFLGLSPSQLEEGKLWTLLSSGFFASNWLRLLADSVALLLLGIIFERRLGSRRYLLAALSTQILGGLLACVFAVGISAAAPRTTWGETVGMQVSVTPATWIFGVAVAGAAALNTLWRRRVRAVLLTVALAMVLFTGQIPDLLVLGGALSGLAVGPLLVGRRPPGAPLVGGTVREMRTLVALVVATAVLGPILVAFNPNAAGPLWPLSQMLMNPDVSPADVSGLCELDRRSTECRTALQAVRLGGLGSALMTLVPSIALLVAAGALRRGLRVAYVGVVVVAALLVAGLGTLATANLSPLSLVDTEADTFGSASGDEWLWSLAPILAFSALAALLLAARRFFQVRLPGGTLRRTVLVVAAITFAGLVVYVLVGLLVGDGFDTHPTISALAADYPARLLPPLYLTLVDPTLMAVSAPARILQSWIGVLVAGLSLAAMWWALRSAPEGSDEASSARLRELLHSPGGSTLSWMSTWPGNSYWFSADGKAAVAYRVRAGVALGTGNPIAHPQQQGDAAVEFAEFCVRQGWTPCMYSVSAPVRDALAERGWPSVQVAEETIIPLANLEFKGKKFQDVRTALNRGKKDGIEARWTCLADTPLAQVEQIIAISEEWVADKGLPEMGFTLGSVDELRDREVRLLLAVDEEGHVHGVTSWMPVYRDGELVGMTLDFMRRRSGGFRPVMEFLIASAALSARDDGLEFLSLSGAPLAQAETGNAAAAGAGRTAEVEAAPNADRRVLDGVLDGLGRSLEPVYGFRSLLAFKAKFQPEYRSLYLSYPDAAALVPIGVAVGRAYLPDVELGQGARLLTRLARR